MSSTKGITGTGFIKCSPTCGCTDIKLTVSECMLHLLFKVPRLGIQTDGPCCL